MEQFCTNQLGFKIITVTEVGIWRLRELAYCCSNGRERTYHIMQNRGMKIEEKGNKKLV
jgi:hypothetical protein